MLHSQWSSSTVFSVRWTTLEQSKPRHSASSVVVEQRASNREGRLEDQSDVLATGVVHQASSWCGDFYSSAELLCVQGSSLCLMVTDTS